MTKIKFAFLFLLNFFISFGQELNGKITYAATSKYASNYYSEKTKKNKKEMKTSLKKLYKNAKDVKTTLKFNKKMSLYHVVDKMETDDHEKINYTHIMAGSEKKYYTHNSIMNYKNNTLDCFLLGECFLIENKIPKWTLKQDTKVIQGFTCYKAIIKNPRNNKTTIEAWYTPEIPYQYGVMNYYGLPGVILEINRNTFSMTATKIELNPIEKIKIEEPKNVKKITEKEFKVLARKAMSGFFKKN